MVSRTLKTHEESMCTRKPCDFHTNCVDFTQTYVNFTQTYVNLMVKIHMESHGIFLSVWHALLNPHFFGKVSFLNSAEIRDGIFITSWFIKAVFNHVKI
jgi:hypothetical protein